MKVLLLAETCSSESGGAYFFQRQVLASLARCPHRHQFCLRNIADSQAANFPTIVDELRIDLIWAIAPCYPRGNVPFVVTVWDIAHRVTPFFPEVSTTGWTWDSRENLYRNALPRAAFVITGTERGKQELITAYGLLPENIKIIPFPVTLSEDDLARQDTEWTFSFHKQRYLYYPAQFWPHKNHVVLIKALRMLRDAGYDLDLVLTGSDKGNRRYIEQYAINNGVGDYVHFLGFVSDAEKVSLYRNARATTYASLFGPNNLPPLEAMALDCPVICADVPGMKEQLQNGVLFFGPTDAADLVAKIKMLDEPDCASNLKAEASRIVAVHTTEAYAQSMLNEINAFATFRECWGMGYVHT